MRIGPNSGHEKDMRETPAARHLQEKVNDWAKTDQGKHVVSEALCAAARATTELRSIRAVDPKMLHEPMTL